MHDILSIKLYALRAARLFPQVKIYFDPAEGVLGRATIPRHLFLLKRRGQLFLVFTKMRFENIHKIFNNKSSEGEELLFESYEAGEYTRHPFGELFQFLIKEEPHQHYLKILVADLNKKDREDLNSLASPIKIFGEDTTFLINRMCCNDIGRQFENSINLLESGDEDHWGRDVLDSISDVCLLAQAQDPSLNDRLLKATIAEFGDDFVGFVRDRSQEIYGRIRHRFNPNLFIRLLLSEEWPSPSEFDA